MSLRKRGLSPQALDLVPVPGGTRLRLRVKPGARTSGVLGIHDGALKVSVTAPAERGRANRAVLDLLSEVLGLPAADLRTLLGETSRSKTVFVPLVPASIAERLTRVLG